MKLTLLTVALLFGTVALAQTQTSTTAAAQAAPAKAKKAKAKKAAPVAAATAESATPAAQNITPAQTSAPAAATSTVTAAPAAPTKNWGVSLVNDTATDYAGGKDLSDAVVENSGYIGASYKVTATEKIGVRQYYIHAYDPNAVTKDFETHDINQSFTVATVSTKIASVLGSDAFSPTLMYFMPGHTAEETNYGKDLDGFAGLLRGDAFVGWTVNPRWSFSYYLSARQTLGATEVYDNAKTGKEATFEATSRMINIGYVNYTINDAVSLYYNAGLDSRMASERMTSTADDFVSSVGSSLVFLDGKLTFYTDVGVTTSLKSKGVAARSQQLYSKENVAYTLTSIISL